MKPRPIHMALIGLFMSHLSSTAIAAERIAVRNMLPVTAQWQQWINDGTALQISGRYDARFSNRFTLRSLPISFTPARNAVLPPDIPTGIRVTVLGVLKKTGTRYTMEATRIVLGTHDLDQFRRALSKTAADKPEAIYTLLANYQSIADFYEDEFLARDVVRVLTETYQAQRDATPNTAVALTQLARRGVELGIDERTLQAIRFQAIVTATRNKSANTTNLIKRLQQQFPGWDEPARLAAAVELRYQSELVKTYESADDRRRRQLHRRLYRELRLPQLTQTLNNDGSNALDIANTVTSELPEESTEIARLRNVYIDYRLARVPRLSRRQMTDLEKLLVQFERAEEFPTVLNDWLAAQKERLNTDELDGMLAMAEEYLFAFENWKNAEHGREGTDLLKNAWKIAAAAAPREAVPIAERLERFGWTRLHDRWMTAQEVRDLPRSDIERAMREGRVVAGMTTDQVLGALGQPSRRLRVISARHVQEIWVFDEAGSTSIAVHMQRLRSQKPTAATATHVTTRQQRF